MTDSRPCHRIASVWRHRPYVIGTGAVALLGIVGGVLVDANFHSSLGNFPITTNLVATSLGVAVPVFFGALFFDKWKVAENTRRLRQVKKEEAARLLISQLTESLIPRIARVRTRLRHNALLQRGIPYLDKMGDQLQSLAQVLKGGHGGLRLSDEGMPFYGADELYSFVLLIPRLRLAIDALEEPLDAVGDLGGSELSQDVQMVRDAIEGFNNALPVGLEDAGWSLKRLTDESGVWNGETVSVANGGSYTMKLAWLMELLAAAKEVTTFGSKLDGASKELRAAAQKQLA